MHGVGNFLQRLRTLYLNLFEIAASFIAVKNVFTFDVTLFLLYGAYSHS